MPHGNCFMNLYTFIYMDRLQLKERRKKMSLTQQDFANLIGISTDKMHRWESGRTKFPAGTERLVEIIEERFDKSKGWFK